MSLTFNLLDDTKITAKFGNEGKRLEVQPKTITNFIVPKEFHVVFVGEGSVSIQLDRYNTTLDNQFSEVQTLEANQPLVMDVRKNDVVKITNAGEYLFANHPFIKSNASFNFTIDEDDTKSINFTNSRYILLASDEKGEISGTATIPSFITYNEEGKISTNEQELVANDKLSLPYNSLIEVNANPADELKYFDSINSETEIPQELYLTEYVDPDLIGKGFGQSAGYWIFIIILIALLVFLIMRYRNSHR